MQHFDAYMDPATHQMQQTIYLAFDDSHHLRRVWADLVRDAPPGVALGGGKQHVA